MSLNVLTQERLTLLLNMYEWGKDEKTITFWDWKTIYNFLNDCGYIDHFYAIIERELIQPDTTYTEVQQTAFRTARLKYIELMYTRT